MFLYSYVPQNLFSSVWVGNAVPFEYSIGLSERIRSKFRQETSNITGKDSPQNSNTSRRNNLLWAISNFSLLIPLGVTIYLFTWYSGKLEVTHKLEKDAKERIDIQEKVIIDNYKELLKVHDSLYNSIILKIENKQK